MPIFDPLHCVPTITIVWVIICYNGYMLLLKHVACSPDEAWTFFGYSSSKNIKCQVQNCLHGKTRFLITMLDFNFALFYHEIWFKCIIHFICIFHVNNLALGVIQYLYYVQVKLFVNGINLLMIKLCKVSSVMSDTIIVG